MTWKNSRKSWKRVSATVNCPTILPDSSGILNVNRHDDDHISCHLLATNGKWKMAMVLLSLLSFVKLEHSFGTREMRTPKCYGNSRDSDFPFFGILSSEVFFLYLLGFWDSSLKMRVEQELETL